MTTNTNPEFIFNEGGMTLNYSNMRWPLTHVSSEDYDNMNVEGNGQPYVWTYRNGGYEVYWYPDQDYDVIVRGVKTYPRLNANADTNDFTNKASDLILYEALARLYAEFRQDPKMENYYNARADNEYKSLKRQNRRRVGTGRIAVQGF